MKTPRRNKTQQSIEQQTAGIPVNDAKALFDAVSKDNTKTITLGVPTEVVRKAPVRMLGETEMLDERTVIGGERADIYDSLPEGVASTLLEQETQSTESTFVPDMSVEDNLNAAIDRAFDAAGLPSDVTTNQLVDQAVEQMNAEGIDFDALLEQGTTMMEQLIAGIDTNGPTIPGTIEMDIEQDDGTIKHCVFDNPDRIGHVVAMAQCDALIQQYDQQKLEQATKPAVKPLRVGWFSWL